MSAGGATAEHCSVQRSAVVRGCGSDMEQAGLTRDGVQISASAAAETNLL